MSITLDGTYGLSLTTPLAVTSGGTGLANFQSANLALLTSSPTTIAAGVLPVAAGGTGVTTYATNGLIYYSGSSLSSSSALTWNGLQLSVAANPTTASLSVPSIVEPANLVSTAINSANVAYLSNGAVQYYTTAAGANWTQQLTHSAGTTLNSVLSVGQAVSFAILVTQGGTAYFSNTINIDGSTNGVTVYWQGNTAPTAGHTNCIDVYSYTVIKTAATPTYTVLAGQTQF